MYVPLRFLAEISKEIISGGNRVIIWFKFYKISHIKRFLFEIKLALIAVTDLT